MNRSRKICYSTGLFHITKHKVTFIRNTNLYILRGFKFFSIPKEKWKGELRSSRPSLIRIKDIFFCVCMSWKFLFYYLRWPPLSCTGWFTMNDTKIFSNNFYSKALYKLNWVPFFHWYPDILIYSFQKIQQVSYNFQRRVELWCLNFENMQNT